HRRRAAHHPDGRSPGLRELRTARPAGARGRHARGDRGPVGPGAFPRGEHGPQDRRGHSLPPPRRAPRADHEPREPADGDRGAGRDALHREDLRVRGRWLGAGLLAIVIPVAAAEPVRVEVDLSGAPRNVAHTTLTFPVSPGPMTLAFPEWLPGEHS